MVLFARIIEIEVAARTMLVRPNEKNQTRGSSLNSDTK
jgi:hypothetical protein